MILPKVQFFSAVSMAAFSITSSFDSFAASDIQLVEIVLKLQ